MKNAKKSKSALPEKKDKQVKKTAPKKAAPKKAAPKKAAPKKAAPKKPAPKKAAPKNAAARARTWRVECGVDGDLGVFNSEASAEAKKARHLSAHPTHEVLVIGRQ